MFAKFDPGKFYIVSAGLSWCKLLPVFVIYAVFQFGIFSKFAKPQSGNTRSIDRNFCKFAQNHQTVFFQPAQQRICTIGGSFVQRFDPQISYVDIAGTPGISTHCQTAAVIGFALGCKNDRFHQSPITILRHSDHTGFFCPAVGKDRVAHPPGFEVDRFDHHADPVAFSGIEDHCPILTDSGFFDFYCIKTQSIFAVGPAAAEEFSAAISCPVSRKLALVGIQSTIGIEAFTAAGGGKQRTAVGFAFGGQSFQFDVGNFKFALDGSGSNHYTVSFIRRSKAVKLPADGLPLISGFDFHQTAGTLPVLIDHHNISTAVGIALTQTHFGTQTVFGFGHDPKRCKLPCHTAVGQHQCRFPLAGSCAVNCIFFAQTPECRYIVDFIAQIPIGDDVGTCKYRSGKTYCGSQATFEIEFFHTFLSLKVYNLLSRICRYFIYPDARTQTVAGRSVMPGAAHFIFVTHKFVKRQLFHVAVNKGKVTGTSLGNTIVVGVIFTEFTAFSGTVTECKMTRACTGKSVITITVAGKHRQRGIAHTVQMTVTLGTIGSEACRVTVTGSSQKTAGNRTVCYVMSKRKLRCHMTGSFKFVGHSFAGALKVVHFAGSGLGTGHIQTVTVIEFGAVKCFAA